MGRIGTLLVSGVLLVAVLSGCDILNRESEPPVDDTSGQHYSVGAPADSLNFDLQATAPPDFDEAGQAVPAEDSPNQGVAPTDMFVEKDGYAYRLDPATLEPIDIPLDPITHEPIEGEKPIVPSSEPTPTTGVAVSTPEETVTTPSRVAPTEGTKYPNTGIFLEDD